MAPPVKDVGVTEFGDLVGVTRQRVHQWVQQGMPHRSRQKGKSQETRIVPREAIRWLREQEREKAQREADGDTPVKAIEEALTARVTRQMKELDYHERKRELVPSATFTEVFEHVVGTFTAVAAGRLQRFEREIVKASTAGEARLVTQAIHVALMEGAQELAEQLDTEAAAIEAADAEELPDEETPAA